MCYKMRAFSSSVIRWRIQSCADSISQAPNFRYMFARAPVDKFQPGHPLRRTSHESFIAGFCRDSAINFTFLGTQSLIGGIHYPTKWFLAGGIVAEAESLNEGM